MSDNQNSTPTPLSSDELRQLNEQNELRLLVERTSMNDVLKMLSIIAGQNMLKCNERHNAADERTNAVLAARLHVLASIAAPLRG